MKIYSKLMLAMSLSLLVLVTSGCNRHHMKLAKSLTSRGGNLSSLTRAARTPSLSSVLSTKPSLASAIRPPSIVGAPSAVRTPSLSSVLSTKSSVARGVAQSHKVSMNQSSMNFSGVRRGFNGNNKSRDKKSDKLQKMPDAHSKKFLQAYNKKHGTQYRTYKELKAVLIKQRDNKK